MIIFLPKHFIDLFRYKGPTVMRNVYPMTKKIRGQCLIIDNEKFVNDVLPYREGSKIDSNNLDILFEQLGFKVKARDTYFIKIELNRRNLYFSKAVLKIISHKGHVNSQIHQDF